MDHRDTIKTACSVKTEQSPLKYFPYYLTLEPAHNESIGSQQTMQFYNQTLDALSLDDMLDTEMKYGFEQSVIISSFIADLSGEWEVGSGKAGERAGGTRNPPCLITYVMIVDIIVYTISFLIFTGNPDRVQLTQRSAVFSSHSNAGVGVGG